LGAGIGNLVRAILCLAYRTTISQELTHIFRPHTPRTSDILPVNGFSQPPSSNLRSNYQLHLYSLE
jgi:hypothetical protein